MKVLFFNHWFSSSENAVIVICADFGYDDLAGRKG